MGVEFVLAGLHAATDELHQGFVAGRYPSPVDVGIDSTGALVALIAIAIILAITGRRSRDSPVGHIGVR